MRTLVFLLVFPISSLVAQTQKSIEVISAVTFIDNTFRNIISPSYTIEAKSHAFSAGPVIQLYTNTGQNNLAKPWITGLRGSYRYIPHRNSKRIDFSFKFDLIYQHIIDKYSINLFDTELGTYEDFKYQNIEDVMEIYAGYGFKFKIHRLYLTGFSLRIEVKA